MTAADCNRSTGGSTNTLGLKRAFGSLRLQSAAVIDAPLHVKGLSLGQLRLRRGFELRELAALRGRAACLVRLAAAFATGEGG